MNNTIIFTFFLLLRALICEAQVSKNYFNIDLNNNSNHQTFLTIQGIDKVDSVPPQQAKTIHFDLDKL